MDIDKVALKLVDKPNPGLSNSIKMTEHSNDPDIVTDMIAMLRRKKEIVRIISETLREELGHDMQKM